MRRRQFLKMGTQAVVLGAAASVPARAASPQETGSLAETPRTPSLLRDYTEEDHRRRIENIGVCTRAIRSCLLFTL